VRVAVLRGGRSSEHDVSLRSGASVGAGLAEAGHEVVDVIVERDGRWLFEGEPVELQASAGLLGCDVAFPVMHGPYGEDGTIQGALEVLGIPYAGPSVLAAATTIDKLTFKRLLADRGVPQVDFCQAYPPGSGPGSSGDPDWRKRVEALGLPVWVKPSRLGSSVGIVKVTDLADLDAAVLEAARFDPRVIVEAHSDGLEVECSVLGNAEPQASVPGEIDAHADWYDYEAKYEDGGMDLVVPARIADGVAEQVRSLAVEVFTALDCTGLARCDFFVTGDGQVLVNELNTLPGFTETSVYSRLFEASGIPYPELCDRLIKLGLERAETQKQYEF
jgi:D-alanine-D-alanine ligase